MTIKILNLYAGIGGNRKFWEGDIEVTAVEINPKIAGIYKDFFPQDKVIIADAHEYLLKHYAEFDFIWSSPPCKTHSVCNYFLKDLGIIRYPDMALYQEIIFLRTYFKGKWAVENTKSYYTPLIKPQLCGRHFIWANFNIPNLKVPADIGTCHKQASKIIQKKANEKNQIERNCVNPRIGKHIFNCAFRIIQKELSEI